MPDASSIYRGMNESLAETAREKKLAEAARHTGLAELMIQRETDGTREPLREALFNGARPETPIIA